MALACITGATGGLGKAFAEECAKMGYDLFLTDTSERRLEVFSGGLERSYGVQVITFACNLAEDSEREALCGRLRDYRGRFGLLINVAGTDFEGLFSTLTAKQIRLLARLNMEAMLELTHEIMPMRRPGNAFRVINVGSLAAFQPMPYKALYAASKRFVLNWSIALREELRGENVTVTTLCPAGMPTTREAIEGINSQGLIGAITTKNVTHVAALTLRRAHRGARLVIPGAVNRVVAWASSALPTALVARVVADRWAHTRQKAGAALRPQYN